MPNIKPVSDFVVKIDGLDSLHATVKLMAQLAEGEKSGREDGWLSADEVEAALGI